MKKKAVQLQCIQRSTLLCIMGLLHSDPERRVTATKHKSGYSLVVAAVTFTRKIWKVWALFPLWFPYKAKENHSHIIVCLSWWMAGKKSESDHWSLGLADGERRWQKGTIISSPFWPNKGDGLSLQTGCKRVPYGLALPLFPWTGRRGESVIEDKKTKEKTVCRLIFG